MRLETSKWRHAALVLAAGSFVFGCMSNAILFTTGTRLGIEINPTEGGQQRVQIGYQRMEGVAMPVRTVETDGAGNETPKLIDHAYSVYALHKFETGSLLLAALTTTKVHQVFAVGQAAINAGRSGAVMEAFGIPACMPLAESDSVAVRLTELLDNPATREQARAAIQEALNDGDDVDANGAVELVEQNRCTREQLVLLEQALASAQ